MQIDLKLVKYYLRIVGAISFLIFLFFKIFNGNERVGIYLLAISVVCFLMVLLLGLAKFLINNYFQK